MLKKTKTFRSYKNLGDAFYVVSHNLEFLNAELVDANYGLY